MVTRKWYRFHARAAEGKTPSVDPIGVVNVIFTHANSDEIIRVGFQECTWTKILPIRRKIATRNLFSLFYRSVNNA